MRITAILLLLSAAQQAPPEHAAPPQETPTPLRKALDLLRVSRTADARRELTPLLSTGPVQADARYQMARSYLLDFYRLTNPAERRTALDLALEALASALRAKPGHIPALRAKAMIHARAELLHYDPNLAYELGARVAQLEPHANAYLLELSEWMSGEVRFSQESEHRVPHDPALGINRSLPLLEHVIDTAIPYSPEETAAFFGMGRALSRRGNFAASVSYFRQVLERGPLPMQRLETLREMGASHFRRGDFAEAARWFYEALQVQNNPLDQWPLSLALQRLPAGGRPVIPAEFVFAAAPSTLEAGRIAFTDLAPALGLDRLDGNGTCAWGDIDNDGDYDLLVSGSGTFMAVYRNSGGRFTDATAEVGLAKVPSGYSLNLIDYDNDGRLDLYISLNGWSGPMPNRLYRNTGGRFVDVSRESGAADAGSGFTAAWGDLDNDGWLDFAVANGVLKDGSTPHVYRNNRNGTFTDVTQAAGIVEPPTYGAIGVALGDYDKDGDLDILINGLNDAPTRLYRNGGGWKFTEVSRTAGVVHPPHNGFVCLFFDADNDALPDILLTSLAPWNAVVEGLRAGYDPRRMHPDASRLFHNNGDGTFRDVTRAAGLHYPMGVMGAGVADLDNDGRLDIYFGTGDPQMTRLEPNRLFLANANGVYSDATAAAGLARPGNKGHGVSFVDLDGDGNLEIYAQLGGHYPGDHARNAFYRNETKRHHWLEVDLTGVKSNRFAVGAQLTLKAGELTVYREVKGSEGFGATDPYRQHFGLGPHTKVDQLEIRWPSGVKQVLREVAADRVVKITEANE